MKTKLTIALLTLAAVSSTCLFSGCGDAKTAIVRVLSTNELEAWCQKKEWERTNVVHWQINSVAISDSEYEQLTNWMRWMRESR